MMRVYHQHPVLFPAETDGGTDCFGFPIQAMPGNTFFASIDQQSAPLVLLAI
jgi:hypothetical protein